MPLPKLREIVRNRRFENELRALEPHVRRADELVEGVEIILARTPECGSQLGDSHVWFVPGYTVTLAVYYTFDEDRVILLSVKRVTRPE
jgi:hypothetical protein